jgi:hypothetical protein
VCEAAARLLPRWTATLVFGALLPLLSWAMLLCIAVLCLALL